MTLTNAETLVKEAIAKRIEKDQKHKEIDQLLKEEHEKKKCLFNNFYANYCIERLSDRIVANATDSSKWNISVLKDLYISNNDMNELKKMADSPYWYLYRHKSVTVVGVTYTINNYQEFASEITSVFKIYKAYSMYFDETMFKNLLTEAGYVCTPCTMKTPWFLCFKKKIPGYMITVKNGLYCVN